MRRLRLSLLVLTTGFFPASCDPCRNLDCLYDDYDGQFRIVRTTDGTDLVFGTSPVYNKNEIRFYALTGADTTFFNSQAIRLPGTGYDSILSVRFFPKADTAYMRLSDGDVDTLAISYRTFGTKCCGTITEITNFRLNNSVDIPASNGTQEIRK